MKKWVYRFSATKTEGSKDMKDLLGGKGANLAEMCSLGLNVPPGFTITAEACLDYEDKGKLISDVIKNEVQEAIKDVEALTGKVFGDNSNPLLFSVRSGSRASMPGMMDTVLNLGLNDVSVEAMAKLTENPRFAFDSYRRFIQMYANVVMNFNISLLEATLEDLKEARGVHEDTELTADDLRELCSVYKKIIVEESGVAFPQDPYSQLWQSVAAVFRSWNNPRAIKYREINEIPHHWGTAVNVQSMVFGNMGDECATGVCFTRNPSTGERLFFGEFLINAQGEDVVAGIRTPAPLNSNSKNDSNQTFRSLEEAMPKAYADLVEVYKKLEAHYKDMQDIEFTIENNQLYILQTRNGKRTAAAAIKIAVDLVKEGILSKDESLMRIKPDDLNQLLHPRLDPDAPKNIIAKGLPASPGAGAGVIVFTSEKAVALKEIGEKVLLVRQETSPEDIAGMVASQGILTARGGMTSHAAVVARGMGKPCVAGCTALLIDSASKTLVVGGKTYREGDLITIDGGTGEVMAGAVATIAAGLSDDFAEYMSWADERRTLGVRANADNPEDAQIALNFGAEGIGLCRTEHMFFEPERILAVREMIFADNRMDRARAIKKIKPFQKADFVGIFKEMTGKPVNIRLLDPPLHEFMPHSEIDKKELAKCLNIEFRVINERASQLQEFNPMLGHRGCRLGVTYPEIYDMQVEAIIEAAIECVKAGFDVQPEIMIPLVAVDVELKLLRERAVSICENMIKEHATKVKYKVGTMIELPRAAITAAEIAPHADFFSFGTNDLTQTTLGLSRDDSGKFLPDYVALGILPTDPFVSIDQSGVGFLVDHACKEARRVRPDMSLGICGEHGGDPKSIDFCHRIGLGYVSCSPFRVPIARLACAQAAIQHSER
jgi:pyruvate, orthophosphate dikinase